MYRSSPWAWFMPTLIFIALISIFGWPWWTFFLLFWLVPKFSRRCFGIWNRWGPNNERTNRQRPKRKRKNDDFDFDTQHTNGSEAVPRRRVIRTSDGEFMTAIEDPETGMLVLEEYEKSY